jgi:hypothetical protein
VENPSVDPIVDSEQILDELRELRRIVESIEVVLLENTKKEKWDKHA